MEPRITLQDTPKGLYELMLNIETYLKKSGIPHSLLHLIKIRGSQINGCGYCLDMHHKDSLKAGETFQRMYLSAGVERVTGLYRSGKSSIKSH